MRERVGWLLQLLTATVALMLVLAGCSSGGDGPELLDADAAAPLFDDLYQAAKPMIGIAAVTSNGEAGDKTSDLVAHRAIERLGTLAQQVVDTVDPADASGALDAFERATRDLTLDAGARQEGGTRVVIRTIMVSLTPDQAARTRKRIEDSNSAQQAKERLRRRIAAAVHRLAYVALLADPTVQARLAPRISPSDLPRELPVDPTDPTGGVDPLLGGFESVGQWRDQIFNEGHLVIPDPNGDSLAWDAFVAWAQYVNPDLPVAADEIYTVFNRVFLSPVRRQP